MGPGKATRMAKPERLWLDWSERVTFFFHPKQSNIRGSRNGDPPVIRIISLHQCYQVQIMIVIAWFGITFNKH